MNWALPAALTTTLIVGGVTMAAPASHASEACARIVLSNESSHLITIQDAQLTTDSGGFYWFSTGCAPDDSPPNWNQNPVSLPAHQTAMHRTPISAGIDTDAKLRFTVVDKLGCELYDDNPPVVSLDTSNPSAPSATGMNGVTANLEPADPNSPTPWVLEITFTADWVDSVWPNCDPDVPTWNEPEVGSATDVEVQSSTSPDTMSDSDVPALLTRSSSPIISYQVATKHHARVEKMAAKVHNSGGVLTIHAYGPDEDLALARARAVRKHLEDHLAKRGHTASSPIWVTYAGDPGRKKNIHVTVHWHPDMNLPGALPGAK